MDLSQSNCSPGEKTNIQQRSLKTSGSILYNLRWDLCEASILLHIPICGPSWPLGVQGEGWTYAWQNQCPHWYGNDRTALYSIGEPSFNRV